MRFALSLLLLFLLLPACSAGDNPRATGADLETDQPATERIAPRPDTLGQPSVYGSGHKTAANLIRTDTIEGFPVDIHLTGSFAWSSETQQRELYNGPNQRPRLFIRELYPGVIFYTRWEALNPESGNVDTVNDKIEYYDEFGQLIKTISIDDKNPYLSQFPNMINNFYNAEGSMGEDDVPEDIEAIHFRNSTNSVHINEDVGFAELIYTLYNSNEDGNIISFETTFIVLDSIGDEVNRIVENGLYVNDTHITPDGRFLAICTDGMVDINDFGNDMGGHADMGIRIYELKSMNLIYENRGRYSDGVAAIDESNWIFFRLKNDNDETTEGDIYLVDPVNKIEYKRSFTYDEWRSVTAKWYREWKGTDQKHQLLEAYDFAERRF
jgi:hypothetical protein